MADDLTDVATHYRQKVYLCLPGILRSLPVSPQYMKYTPGIELDFR